MHELGEGKKHDILGHEIITSNHNPLRNYYARRNLIYLARRHYIGKKKITKIVRQIIYGVGIIILEDKKILRMKYNLRGIIDGFRMK